MKKLLLLAVAGLLVTSLAAAACGDDDDDSSTPSASATATRPATAPAGTSPTAAASATTSGAVTLENPTVLPSGLKYVDKVVGTGATPRNDQQVTVHYTLYLASNGKKIQSSRDNNGQPITFSMQGVIRGFAEALSTMKVGGQRTAYLPANIAYGANPPQGSGIPQNADLVFDIELVAVK